MAVAVLRRLHFPIQVNDARKAVVFHAEDVR